MGPDECSPDEYRRRCVETEPMALEEEYVRLPADLAYWNARFADCLRTYLRTKLDFEQTEARLRLETRERLLADAKKPTESQVDATVLGLPEMVQARLLLVEAEVAKVRAAGVCEAVRAKKDMLVSLGAHVRAEMNGDPMIREQHRTAGEVRR